MDSSNSGGRVWEIELENVSKSKGGRVVGNRGGGTSHSGSVYMYRCSISLIQLQEYNGIGYDGFVNNRDTNSKTALFWLYQA